jgi:hypothetical protein
MEIEASSGGKVADFFEKIVAARQKGPAQRYILNLKIKFERNEAESQRELTREEVESCFNKGIEKQLGKVGLSKFSYSIDRIWAFDSQVDISIESITSEEFCELWSTLAFACRTKLQLLDIDWR